MRLTSSYCCRLSRQASRGRLWKRSCSTHVRRLRFCCGRRAGAGYGNRVNGRRCLRTDGRGRRAGAGYGNLQTLFSGSSFFSRGRRAGAGYGNQNCSPYGFRPGGRGRRAGAGYGNKSCTVVKREESSRQASRGRLWKPVRAWSRCCSWSCRGRRAGAGYGNSSIRSILAVGVGRGRRAGAGYGNREDKGRRVKKSVRDTARARGLTSAAGADSPTAPGARLRNPQQYALRPFATGTSQLPLALSRTAPIAPRSRRAPAKGSIRRCGWRAG